MNATATADVGPLVWRRVRAGLHEADAGRFGKYVIERRPNGMWYVGDPGATPTPIPNRSLGVSQERAARWLARKVAADPRTLLEWGVAILYRQHGADPLELYEHAVCRPGCPLWFMAAAGSQFLPGDPFPAGPVCLALRWAWEAAARSDQMAAIARDCIADPSLLGVLADAAQDAGNPTLEEAARSVAAAIESLRAREG